MIELQEKFFKIVDNAVMLNLELQLMREDSKKYMARGHWLAEFGTVSIDAGRAIGKTSYIASRMKPCDLVITAMHDDVMQYTRLKNQSLDNVMSAKMMFDRVNMAECWRGRWDPVQYWNKVYVDEPAQVFAKKDSRYQFIDWFGGRCNQVIMLGTPVRL